MRNNGKRYVTQKAFGRESPYAWFKDVLSMDQWTAASVTVVPALVRVTSEWPHASSVTWLQLVWRWYQLLSGLLVNSHMPRVSRQSRLSLMINVIMMILGTPHRSPGIYLKAEENPGKPKLETVDEGCANIHRLKWRPLPPNRIGRIAQHVRKGEWRKGRGGDLMWNYRNAGHGLRPEKR